MPVASSLAHPQMASSALKSGLYPGRTCPRENGGSPVAVSDSVSAGIPASPPHDGLAHCPKSPSRAQDAFLSVASGRQPRCPSCCCHPVPSIPPPPSPSIPLSSSWPSPRSWDWWSPPEPAPVKTGGRFSLLHPLPPQLRVRPEVGLVSEEYPGPCPLGLLPHSGILSHEGCPLLLISLQQPFLGPLESKSQPVQPVQATAAAQAGAKAFQDKLPYRLPIPVGQFQARRRWRLLHRRLQLLLFRLVKGGGEPPVCSKINALEPPSPKADAHRPMV